MRDLSGIYKESKQSFYLFSTQGLLISDVSCHHHCPVLALSSGSRATTLTSGVTLLGFHFPPTDTHVQIFTLLIICSLCPLLMFLIIVVINRVAALLCSPLHFPPLTRAAGWQR